MLPNHIGACKSEFSGVEGGTNIAGKSCGAFQVN